MNINILKVFIDSVIIKYGVFLCLPKRIISKKGG